MGSLHHIGENRTLIDEEPAPQAPPVCACLVCRYQALGGAERAAAERSELRDENMHVYDNGEVCFVAGCGEECHSCCPFCLATICHHHLSTTCCFHNRHFRPWCTCLHCQVTRQGLQGSPCLHHREADDFRTVFPGAVWVAGGMHLVHTCMEHLTGALSYFPTFLEALRLLVEFADARHLRERFVATCLIPQQAPASFAAVFKSGSLSVQDWRWGSIILALKHLSGMMLPLRLYWDDSAMRFKDGEMSARSLSAGSGDTADKRLQRMGVAIRSTFFWSYSQMLLALAGGLDSLSTWLLSCKCHTKQETDAMGPCPMMGRHASDMALGTWRHHFNEVLDTSSAQLLVHTLQLSVEDRDLLMREFHRGRDAMMLAVQLKFAQWERLPGLLAGVAHDDAQLARIAAQQCCDVYAKLPLKSPERQHPWVRKFLGESSCMSQRFRAFAEGRADRAPLLHDLWGIAMIPVNEISIESKHALAKTKLRSKPHHSPALFSLCLRAPEIREHVESSQKQLHALASQMQDMKTDPFAIPAVFGMQELPSVQTVLNSASGDSSTLKRLVRSSFYRCDLHSQYDKLSATVPMKIPEAVPSNASAGSGGLLRCLQHAFAAHLRVHLPKDTFISVPWDESLRLLPLRADQLHHPVPKSSSNSEQGADEAGLQQMLNSVCFPLGGRHEHQPCVMMRVVRERPSQVRQTGEKIDPLAIAVTVHQVTADHEAHRLLCSLDPWPVGAPQVWFWIPAISNATDKRVLNVILWEPAGHKVKRQNHHQGSRVPIEFLVSSSSVCSLCISFPWRLSLYVLYVSHFGNFSGLLLLTNGPPPHPRPPKQTKNLEGATCLWQWGCRECGARSPGEGAWVPTCLRPRCCSHVSAIPPEFPRTRPTKDLRSGRHCGGRYQNSRDVGLENTG